MISFITSNPGKFEYASRELKRYGVTLEQKSLDIVEIQSSNTQDITLDKARKAYDILHKPLIVTDANWNIPSLNGFPGAYMHDICRWFTTEDFLNLLKDKEDKSLIREYVAVYKDKDVEKVFTSTFKGRFIDTPKGKGGTNVDKITTFRKDGKTSSECNDENINFQEFKQHPLWKDVGEWLSSR
jgi:non-canonical purine NTP pyrophosphatase (RdgB/HAM1 family)